MSVVVATPTPQPEHTPAVREAALATVPRVHAEDGCERYALHEARDGSLVVIEQRADPEAPAAHGRDEPFSELSRQLEGEPTGAPQPQALTALPTGDGIEGGLQTQLWSWSSPSTTYWVSTTSPPSTRGSRRHAARAPRREVDPASQLSSPCSGLVRGTTPVIRRHW